MHGDYDTLAIMIYLIIGTPIILMSAFLSFLVLKIVNHIKWGWWSVFSPLILLLFLVLLYLIF